MMIQKPTAYVHLQKHRYTHEHMCIQNTHILMCLNVYHSLLTCKHTQSVHNLYTHTHIHILYRCTLVSTCICTTPMHTYAHQCTRAHLWIPHVIYMHKYHTRTHMYTHACTQRTRVCMLHYRHACLRTDHTHTETTCVHMYRHTHLHSCTQTMHTHTLIYPMRR